MGSDRVSISRLIIIGNESNPKITRKEIAASGKMRDENIFYKFKEQ